tara:strand:+ start:9254 stop:9967 length:714 start_codon:yes stop_codon:yes gene_type:complete
MFLFQWLLGLALASPVEAIPDKSYRDVWDSSVVIVSEKRGIGSGNLVTVSNMDVIVTSAHVIADETTTVAQAHLATVAGDSTLSLPTTLAGSYNDDPALCVVKYLDFHNDLAVIVPITPMQGVTPIPLLTQDAHRVGDSLYYVGHPNANGKMLVKGSLSGTYKGLWIMEGFGWMGASGSGVFDEKGTFLGVLRGIDTDPQQSAMLEDVVFLVDIGKLDIPKLVRAVETHEMVVIPPH